MFDCKRTLTPQRLAAYLHILSRDPLHQAMSGVSYLFQFRNDFYMPNIVNNLFK